MRRTQKSSGGLAVEVLEDRNLPSAYIVNTILDDPYTPASATDGLVSLREATNAASTNAAFGDAAAGQGAGITDTITFDAALGGQTIVLGGDVLQISDHLAITGLGAANLRISGGEVSGLFSVAGDATATIAHLTLSDGDAYEGGAVYNEGTLAINNCTLARNTASYGGTIFNLGALTLTNCSVADNYSWQVAGGIWNGGTLDIIGGTFTNNYTEGNGGGIGNRLGFVTIDGTLFANNYGRSSGGAIDHYDYFSTSDGTLDVANCTFRDNYGGTGGAIWSKDPTTIANSTFTGNTAGLAGGAIAHRGGPLTIATSVLTNNQSARYGGAIDVTNYGGANAVIRQSLFAGNSTDREGGAIENYLGTLELVNSTISGNSSNREGGGIWNWGTLKLTNATISGNRADSLGTWTGDGGGGLFNYGGTPVLNNTILAGNKRGPAVAEVQDDVFGSVDSASSHNFIGDAASAGGLTHGANGNIVGVNVALILDTNLANNGGPTLTHALLPGSIAVDAGLNALASGATDQRGAPRILDGNGDAVETVDIGAFELVTPAGLIQHVKNQVEQLGDSGLLTHGQQTSLLMLLENALANLRRDNTAAATQLLRTFLERVQHLVDAGALAPGAAEELTAPVLYLLGILGG